MNWMSYSGGPIRLTFKEAARAKAGTCLVVRTQPNGTWLVAMVSTDSGMPVGEVCYVANPAEAEAAAKQLIDLRSSGGKQASLRAKVVRLAHAKPELRPHLLPLLKSASAAAELVEPLKELQQLDELADNIEAITDVFSLHFKTAAAIDPQVKSQFDALTKARAGSDAAEKVKDSLQSILKTYPDDKTALRAVKDAETMFARFTKLESEAAAMIRKLSQKASPEALKKLSVSAAEMIRKQLVDPKSLLVIPWQREANASLRGATSVAYQVVLRVMGVGSQGSVSLTIEESTGNAIGPYLAELGVFPPKPTTAKEAATTFLSMLSGWSGLKGEDSLNAARAEVGKRIAAAVKYACKSLSYDIDPIEIQPLKVSGGFRLNRLEGMSEWDRDAIISKEESKAEKLLAKAIGADMASVKGIRVGYQEKGWYGIEVLLK